MRLLIFIGIFFLGACNTKMYVRNISKEIENYNLKDVDTLVDIGCGNGSFDRMIAHDYPNLYFVIEDLEYQISYTKKEVTESNKKYLTIDAIKNGFRNSKYIPSIESHYQLVIGTEDSIPLPSGKCRRVLCRRTLHEFKNPGKMTSELERILSDDGILTIVEVEPNYTGEKDIYCKSPYLTKDSIREIFKSLRLKKESSIIYPDRTLNILDFSK